MVTYTANTSVTFTGEPRGRTLRAVFVPDSYAALDLRADLDALLRKAFPANPPSLHYGVASPPRWYTWDGNADGSTAFPPNGIPDGDEFYLLERVLKEGAAVVTQAQATETAVAFYRNQVLMNYRVGTRATPAQINALAAYATIGDTGSYGAASTFIRTTLGVTVPPPYTSYTKMSGLLSKTANPDGDDYDNLGEWGYVSLYETQPDALATDYTDAAFDDTVPPATFDPETVETVEVTIEVIGQGTTVPAPGTHEFAKYTPGCTPPCTPLEITLTAASVGDNVFLHWKPGGGKYVPVLARNEWDPMKGGKLPMTSIIVPLKGDVTLTATFEPRPGIGALDLVSDLGQFLLGIGELLNPADVVNNEWDRGVVEYDDNGAPVFSGNGIPDAMEFELLETVLKDAALDMAFEGGVFNYFVYQDWLRNLAQAQHDLPALPASVQRAVAAYMTIGDYGLTSMVEVEVQQHFGIALDATPYSVKSSRHLGFEADCRPRRHDEPRRMELCGRNER